MGATATTSLSNWKFQQNHVQQNLIGGDFAGSHSVILCATAPRLDYMSNKGEALAAGTGAVTGNEGSEFAIPIGVVDSASLSQNSQLAQIFEIGSKRSYILRGRTISTLQIARVFYKGPTLMRALYAYYPGDKLGAGNQLSDNPSDPAASLRNDPIAMDEKFKATLNQIKNPAGYGNFFLNLDSELFSYPIGLVLYFKDNLERDIGAVFLQECYIEAHQMGISANSIVIAENVSLRFERIIPMKVQSVTSATSAGAPTSDIFGGNNPLAGIAQSVGNSLVGTIQNSIPGASSLISGLGGIVGL